MKRTLTAIAATLSLSLAGGPALAHSDEKPAHGGRLVEAGQHHLELTVKQTDVDVYVTDAANKAISASGVKGFALFTIDGKTVRVPLAYTSDNRLTGKSDAALPAKVKGVVQITLPDGKSAQGKFN